MNILFVSTHVPVPVNNGQAIRTSSILQALASSGHHVTFVSLVGIQSTAGLDPLPSYCCTIDLTERGLSNVSQGSDYFRRLGCLLSLKPYSIERFRCEEMQAKIRRHLQATAFDLIFCDSLYALRNVPPTDIPIALNCHNVEHVIFQRFARMEKNPVRKWYARIEGRLVEGVERESCGRAALAMACSETDRDILRQTAPNLPIFVVPNAVDASWFEHDTAWGSPDQGQTILFQGGMDWYPNRDAVEFFALRILPSVRMACPDVKFVVAGRNPPADFVEKFRGDIGIEFTGTVPNMRPYVAAATVVVAPLRLGSGTRIKILEACAAGKAVVSTHIGAEGLAFQQGKQILLADAPEDFARSVIGLLRDERQRLAVGHSAKTAVLQRYVQSNVKQSLDAAISNLRGQDCLPSPAEPVESCL